jgi:hypothetical protein
MHERPVQDHPSADPDQLDLIDWLNEHRNPKQRESQDNLEYSQGNAQPITDAYLQQENNK